MTELQLAWYVALGGWILLVVQALIGYLERRSQQKQELLLTALTYFIGGRQRRSVGIALIEGLWARGTRFHEVIVPALTNQAVYLLLDSGLRKSRPEMHNFLRIIALMTRAKSTPATTPFYAELANALEIRIHDENEAGIEMAPATARLWRQRLSPYVGEYHEST